MSNVDNQSPSSIVTMWVLLEGKRRPVEIDIEQKNVTRSLNLDRLDPILKEEFNELRDVERSDIEFFSRNDYNTLTPLPSDTPLTSLTTTASKPLVVRYPLSNASIIVKYRFLRNSDKYEMPHSSGSLILLREAVQKSFKKLETSDFYFVAKTNSEERKIENEFQFNKLVNNSDRNYRDEYSLDLKIQIKGNKAYGDWTFKEVSKEIYNGAFDSYTSMPTFKIEDFELNPLLKDDDLELFVKNLQQKMRIFHKEVASNEATTREFISVFLSLGVDHVLKCNDSTTRLRVEVELDGSRGYGFLDYGVYIKDAPVLVSEAKPFETEKAIAQTLVQIHSAAESSLGKRKRSETDPEQTIFGIVTTGRTWRFIRWSGTLESPKAEITKEYNCDFEEDMKKAKVVVSHIVRVLQAQAKSLKEEEPCVKRLCTDK